MTYILSINPGATSTKCALYNDNTEVFKDEVRYSLQSLEQFETLKDQLDMRYRSILDSIKHQGYDIKDIEVVVARGGILPPVEAGAMEVDDALVDYLLNKSSIAHPANLAAAMAKRIVDQNGKGKAYIYDPISVDQLDPIARVSGFKGIERKSVGHILNSRAVALKYAKEKELPYEALNLIVIHAGSGITATAHHKGRMVDLIGDDEGSFSPERIGGLPLRTFMDMCYNNIKEEVVKNMRHRGGLVSYFGTNDVRDVEALIASGDQEAACVLEAMAYQIAKSIGALSVVLNGNVDAIIISGGFSRSEVMMEWIRKRVSFIADFIIYPGEYELEALAFGGYRAYKNEEPTHRFQTKY